MQLAAVARSLGPVSPWKLSPDYGNLLSSPRPPVSCFGNNSLNATCVAIFLKKFCLRMGPQLLTVVFLSSTAWNIGTIGF